MADRLAEALQNTRIHQESASHALSVQDAGHWCLKAAVDVDMPRLLAAVNVVMKRHEPGAVQRIYPLDQRCAVHDQRTGGFFRSFSEIEDCCGSRDYRACSCGQEYPCSYVRDISRALLGEEAPS